MLLDARADDRRLCAGRHLVRDAAAGGGRAARATIRVSTVLPVEADFTKPFRLPRGDRRRVPRVGFFPGSTIGNFEPHEAAAFLSHAAFMLGEDATLIIGFDLVKDVRDSQRRLQRCRRRDRALQPQSADAHQPRARRQFRSRRVLPPGVLQHRAAPHRDASRQPQAPEGEGGRTLLRIPRRRNHPHREQLQVHAGILRRDGARLGLDAGRRVDRPERLFLGAGADKSTAA